MEMHIVQNLKKIQTLNTPEPRKLGKRYLFCIFFTVQDARVFFIYLHCDDSATTYLSVLKLFLTIHFNTICSPIFFIVADLNILCSFTLIPVTYEKEQS